MANPGSGQPDCRQLSGTEPVVDVDQPRVWIASQWPFVVVFDIAARGTKPVVSGSGRQLSGTEPVVNVPGPRVWTASQWPFVVVFDMEARYL